MGNLIESNGVDATLLYEYDLLSRVTAATQVYDDREEVITYLYNGDNLRTMMVWGDKSWVYQYDANHRTQHLTNPYGETTSFTYASCCTAVEEVLHANGAKIKYAYDMAERITEVLNLKPNGAILKSFGYERDANGMVTSVERENPYWNQAYLYDNRLQLQGASYGFPSWMNELYFYDGRGNRLEKWVDGGVAETYGYNAADEIQSRQLDRQGTERYTYAYEDSAEALMTFTMDYLYDTGYNITWKHEVQTFDYREKMVHFSKLDEKDWWTYTKLTVEADYSYLPDGIGRVGKKSSKTWTMERPPGTQEERTTYTDKDTFVLNDFYNMLDEEITTAESINGGPPAIDTVQKVYTMGPGIDFPLAMRHNADSYLYYLNGHGDVTGFVSMDGSYEEPYNYNSWGALNELTNLSSFSYEGKQYDSDTDMIFYRTRYFMPEIGRFNKKDMILSELNAFIYPNNDIKNHVDPFGTRDVDDFVEGILTVLGSWWCKIWGCEPDCLYEASNCVDNEHITRRYPKTLQEGQS